jgi:dienelactone hydrolase
MRRSTARVRGALVTALAVVAALLVAMVPAGSASASGFGTQRGPNPTLAMIEASKGSFATAQLKVSPGNGFNGGEVYYPTDTSLGTWGALAIVPGYTAKCADQEAWMGPWLASFGFVVMCVETNTPTDWDTTRGQELLSALTWLTNSSPVKGRVDASRLAVMGHSMGGGGVVYATEHRPALKAGIALAPFSPSQNMSSDKVPTLVFGGQKDPTVTPSYLRGLYATMPAATKSAFAQIAGANHLFYTHPNNVQMKLIIPWLKIFVDNDNRYEKFLCPSLPDPSKISMYQPKCPYIS